MHLPTYGCALLLAGVPMLRLSGCDQKGEAASKEHASRQADATRQKGSPMNTQQATFAAGCFWGVELEFANTPGVIKTTVGYTGGKTKNPTYEDVCSHTTGHAEAVLVEYDPDKVSYDKLLNLFWEIHDPTQLNRQGPDYGDNYRSAIFFHSPEQATAAKAGIERLQKSGKYSKPIVTQLVPAVEFYPAESYHQGYLARRGAKSCHRPGG